MLLPTTTTTTATPQTIKSWCRHDLVSQSVPTLTKKMICQSVVAILVLCSLVSPQPGYPSLLLRCSQCAEAEEAGSEVCGSDWKTYRSQCQLEWEACKRNWSIVVVAQGQCVSQCQDVDLGMFSATGTFRATNKGSCIQDYFRCRKLSNQKGLEGQVAKECCLER